MRVDLWQVYTTATECRNPLAMRGSPKKVSRTRSSPEHGPWTNEKSLKLSSHAARVFVGHRRKCFGEHELRPNFNHGRTKNLSNDPRMQLELGSSCVAVTEERFGEYELRPNLTHQRTKNISNDPRMQRTEPKIYLAASKASRND